MDIEFLKQNGVDTDKALALFGDMDTYNETFKDYLEGIEEKKAKLKFAKDNANWSEYAIFAHSIKSDARYLGFTDIAAICLEHEMAGKDFNQHFILKNYDNMLQAVDKMTDIVKRYLAGEKAKNGEEKKEVPVEKPVTEEIKQEHPSDTLKDVVVVADDSPIVSNFASRALNNLYEVIVAKDGAELINIINSNRYNIKALLLDLNMPNVGGFQVLEYLKNSNRYEKLPVSIITGEDSKNMIDKAFTYNIVDVLVKPFSKDDLVRVLEKTINFSK